MPSGLDPSVRTCLAKCDAGGNVLDLVARMENTDTYGAAKLLKEWFDIDAEKAGNAAKSIGPTARGEALDVRDPDAVEAAMRRILATEGRLDILVASAAIPLVKPVLDTEPGDWEQATAVVDIPASVGMGFL